MQMEEETKHIVKLAHHGVKQKLSLLIIISKILKNKLHACLSDLSLLLKKTRQMDLPKY